ncbi:MAG: OmpA family protein [Gammaproteobacteria bacterium]|jgi:outer membrane protein OmpA-like peptidoglycan-associated protein|nr:OmpA family protein [Gammaproteobacteria bacterium]
MLPTLVNRIVAFSVLISLVEVAYSENFKAPIDASQWKTSTSKLECRLSHTIPGYGHATFSQESHEHQRFILVSILGRLTPGKAKLEAYPPHWHYHQQKKKIAQLPVSVGQRPIKMTDNAVYELLQSLELGNTPAFIMTPANTAPQNSPQHDKVVLSPVGFQKPYKEYLQCIAQMIPDSFNELKVTTLHFESGSAILSRGAEARLKEVAAFIRADGKIRKITIEGHSDSKGSYQANAYLANQRMWAIKDFFVLTNGISPKMFVLKDFADKVPVAPNKTAAGRAKNRRVVIKLYR